MSDDLVKELAGVRCMGIEELCWQAADHIEALVEENARLKHALVVWDAAMRTGRNEPLVVAFETGKQALEVAKEKNND